MDSARVKGVRVTAAISITRERTSVAKMAPIIDLRSVFLSSGDSDDKMPLASSIAMPTAQWWFSSTEASL